MKACSKCHELKPKSDFYSDKRRKDGLYSSCKSCFKEVCDDWAARNPEKVKARQRNWKLANPEKDKAKNDRYWANHPEKYKEKNRRHAIKWRAENPEKALEHARTQNRKIRSTPKGHVSNNISREMNRSLRAGKAGRHWETLVDFTVDQLKSHLEKKFTPEMNWENYGSVWEIDHKIPIAVHNFEKPEDLDFRLCWSLKNLQPLGKAENRSKSDKIDMPFQPSLAIAGG